MPIVDPYRREHSAAGDPIHSSVKGGTPPQFIEDVLDEHDCVILSRRVTRRRRQDESESLAVRRDLEACGAGHVPGPHSWLVREKRPVARRIANGHDLITGLIEQLDSLRQPYRLSSTAVGNLHLAFLPG